MDQSTVNSAFFKTGLNKFKNFRLINDWSQEQQEEYFLVYAKEKSCVRVESERRRKMLEKKFSVM